MPTVRVCDWCGRWLQDGKDVYTPTMEHDGETVGLGTLCWRCAKTVRLYVTKEGPRAPRLKEIYRKEWDFKKETKGLR